MKIMQKYTFTAHWFATLHPIIIFFFYDIKSQPIWAETWSWPAAASWAPAARSTRARSCRRTRWCTAPTASGACRARSRRSANPAGARLRPSDASRGDLLEQINLTRRLFFSSRSLRLCSSTSSWRSCPTITTWRRRSKATARQWETKNRREKKHVSFTHVALNTSVVENLWHRSLNHTRHTLIFALLALHSWYKSVSFLPFWCLCIYEILE